MPKVTRDLIALPEAEGRWVLMNVFARTCLAVESAALEVLRAAEGSGATGPALDRRYQIWEVGYFSNGDGLLADPTRYRRNPAEWPPARDVDRAELLDLFRKSCFLIEDEAAYRARFAPKTSLLDSEHFGNFHQQVGQELMLRRRMSASKWWISQKFTDDLQHVRRNLYGAVQDDSLDRYFRQRFKAGDAIVDIGCGTGYYANKMARLGARVLGVDPSEEYLAVARANATEGARFERAAIGEPEALAGVPTASADYVFMSDALLFYFFPPVPQMKAELGVLFDDIRRILKPGGRFISVEPHHVFWLLPWLGDPARPFTVMTEYLHRSFHVTASLGGLLQAFARGGFRVAWMEELVADPSHEATDARAYHFAREFPLWHLFELLPGKDGEKDCR